jgi:SAM-dependent methyltransferase
MSRSFPELDLLLRDPRGAGKLMRRDRAYEAEDGKRFPDVDGLPSLVYPEEVAGSDGRWNRFYDAFAPFYTVVQNAVSRVMLGESAAEAHQKVIARIPIPRGGHLLEVSPGPGVFHHALRGALGDGMLIALDLSRGMLSQCRKRGDQRAHLVHGNGQALPFADGVFDCVFHFGGVNLFNEPATALREFVRVAKPGGVVSWGDEGFAEGSGRDTFKKRFLTRLNPGYLKPRPQIPAGLVNVTEHTVYGGFGYLVVARKA